MGGRHAALGALLVGASAASAWADHGGELSHGRLGPVVTALLWGGAAFLAGLAIIGVVALLSRRRPPPPDA
jgi:hypothetical protein